MKDIGEIRQTINEIDEQMRYLFEKRMDAVKEVAEYKSAHSLPIKDEAREAQIIEYNSSKIENEKIRPYYVSFLKATASASRAYQAALMSDTNRIRIELGKDSYDIYVGQGLLGSVDKLINTDRRILIVTDSGVPEIYAKTVAAACTDAHIHVIEQGEESKNLDTFARICDKMLKLGMQRKDAVIAVGGGVVGDVAGFASACYMRGIDFYNIPTTLLSQVDSSIGGKTAIDFCGTKNIIGAFHQPKAVIIDTDVLKTLDKRQHAAGLAEAVKMALTSDKELFELLEGGLWKSDTSELILRSLLIKKTVVEADEKECSLRRILNFGHTFGHGIEAVSNLYHGECVAIGMIPMCSSAVRERLVPLLEDIGLPTSFDCDFERAIEFMRHDKKGDADMTYAVFSDEIGTCRIEKLPFDTLEEHIRKNIR